MRTPSWLLACTLLLAGTFLLPSARAAESLSNCTGFIDALPATIGSQGVWCLSKNLNTSITQGPAIHIAANNVTVDCNDFAIDGTPAGNTTEAVGISADSRANVTVRRCGIRGFTVGVSIDGGSGHLIEDNLLVGNLVIGISALGDDGMVRNNRVHDTGAAPSTGFDRCGILVRGDAIGNTVDGVTSLVAGKLVRGIMVKGDGNEARGNRVRGVVPAAGDLATGIGTNGYGITATDNRIVGNPAVPTPGQAIGSLDGTLHCVGNTTAYFGNGLNACAHRVGNLPAP